MLREESGARYLQELANSRLDSDIDESRHAHARRKQSGFRPEEEHNYKGATYGWQRFIGGLEGIVARLH
jgi:hypothetical protein